MTTSQKALRFSASAGRKLTAAKYAALDAFAATARNLGIVTAGWALDRGQHPFRSLRTLLTLGALGAAGWYVGWHGYGTWSIQHDRIALSYWHEFLAPATAIGIPALVYSNGLVTRFFGTRGLNSFALALFALPMYALALVLTFALWGFWTFPFYILGLIANIGFAIVSPLLRRAIVSLTPTAADTAARIVRDMARTPN